MPSIQRKHKRTEQKSRNDGTFANAVEVATFAGTSEQAIKRAVTIGKLRQGADGSFSRESVAAWIEQRRGGRPRHKNDADERLKKIKGDIAQLQLNELRGKLIRKSDAERAFTDRAYEISRGIMDMGRKLSRKIATKMGVPAKPIQDIFDAEARELLEEYSRPLQVTPEK
jgi:hypothetical protein